MVVDERGGIDGVVTTTDIFAAIAGDLADDEVEAAWTRVDDQTIEADATIALSDLREPLGLDQWPSSGRYSTLGGFLLFEFGRMPDVGDQIRRFGFDFTVLSIRPSRIARVMIVASPSV